MNKVKVTIVEILEDAFELPNGQWLIKVMVDCYGTKRVEDIRINDFDIPKYVVGYNWEE